MSLWAEHSGLTVALAPFCDLVEARAHGLAGDTFSRLLSEPLVDPERYSPAHRLPRSGTAVVVASPADRLVPMDQIRRYVGIARQHGSAIDLLESQGGHFDLLEPSTSSWELVIDALGARNATV
jgi:hypothetical protein